MTTMQASALSWLAGAAFGAAVSKGKHPVFDVVLGAFVVGGISDALIERRTWPFHKVR